jgi:hypothetical protein
MLLIVVTDSCSSILRLGVRSSLLFSAGLRVNFLPIDSYSLNPLDIFPLNEGIFFSLYRTAERTM